MARGWAAHCPLSLCFWSHLQVASPPHLPSPSCLWLNLIFLPSLISSSTGWVFAISSHLFAAPVCLSALPVLSHFLALPGTPTASRSWSFILFLAEFFSLSCLSTPAFASHFPCLYLSISLTAAPGPLHIPPFWPLICCVSICLSICLSLPLTVSLPEKCSQE